MNKAPTPFKDVVVVWEQPDHYFGRRTPAFSYTVEDSKDVLGSGTWKNMNDCQHLLDYWREHDGPMQALLEYFGDPAWVGVLETKGSN
jgi:hypothetical protein